MPNTRDLGFRVSYKFENTYPLVLGECEFCVVPLSFLDWLGSVVWNFYIFLFYNSRFRSGSAARNLLALYPRARVHKSAFGLWPNELSAFFWVVWYTSSARLLLLRTRGLPSSPNSLIQHLKLRSWFFWHLLNFVLVLDLVGRRARDFQLLLSQNFISQCYSFRFKEFLEIYFFVFFLPVQALNVLVGSWDVLLFLRLLLKNVHFWLLRSMSSNFIKVWYKLVGRFVGLGGPHSPSRIGACGNKISYRASLSHISSTRSSTLDSLMAWTNFASFEADSPASLNANWSDRRGLL